MKIDKIKVNSYGKLKEKEIDFKSGINIIYGENEKGKSTLLNFITNMFYGTSKNKKGRNISDYDRFKPWDTDDFSGKINYTLDNNEEFEVFREFGKKNPKIYNAQKEDISKDYSIDKNTGSQFFYEQTKVDESTFLSTVVSFQNEVEIDNQTQNILLQKIANTSSTGNDNISYKKAIDKLNKKQLDEIGTSRSQEKPINIVNNEISRIKNINDDLKKYENYKYEIEDKQEELNKQMNWLQYNYDALKEFEIIRQEENIEKSKLKFNQNGIDEIENQIQNLMQEREILEQEKKEIFETDIKSINFNLYIIISVICIILSIVIAIFVKPIFSIITVVLAMGIYIFALNKKNKIKAINQVVSNKNKSIMIHNQDTEKKVYEINAQINLLEQNQKNRINETEQIKNEILKNINIKKENAVLKYKSIIGDKNIENIINCNNFQMEINNLQNEINNVNMELHKLNIDKENILPKLEELAENEEKLVYNENQKRLLEEKNNAINLAKQCIEIAYQKMKRSVTPKFTESLSENISEITDGKYDKIIINEDNGIMVELPNGEYKEAYKLSLGTIQQLYLSFRISMVNNISDECMPIMFDEVFAYYDDRRLIETIKLINDMCIKKRQQVMFFTCTDREEMACKKLGIEFNKIML